MSVYILSLANDVILVTCRQTDRPTLFVFVLSLKFLFNDVLMLKKIQDRNYSTASSL